MASKVQLPGPESIEHWCVLNQIYFFWSWFLFFDFLLGLNEKARRLFSSQWTESIPTPADDCGPAGFPLCHMQQHQYHASCSLHHCTMPILHHVCTIHSVMHLAPCTMYHATALQLLPGSSLVPTSPTLFLLTKISLPLTWCVPPNILSLALLPKQT